MSDRPRLRAHVTDRQVTDLLVVVSLGGVLDRDSDTPERDRDTLAAVTDQESVAWAEANLTSVGWDLGKHTGAPEEQRPVHPTTLARTIGRS